MIQTVMIASFATMTMSSAVALYLGAAARTSGLANPDMSLAWTMGAGGMATMVVTFATLVLYGLNRGRRTFSVPVASGFALIANCAAFGMVALLWSSWSAAVMASGAATVAGTVVVVWCACWVLDRLKGLHRTDAARS